MNNQLLIDLFYKRNQEQSLQTLQSMDRKQWLNFLKHLSYNRILFHFIAKIFPKYFHQLPEDFQSDLITLTRSAKTEEQKTQRTIAYYQKYLPQAVLVKTYKFIPYVTFDLDLLVDNADSVELDLQKKQHPGKQNKHQKNYEQKNMLRLDLHDNFYWQGFKYLDLDLVSADTQKVHYFGYSVTIPSYTAEFLLNCAHILFERRYITFLDFWYLKLLMDEEKVDWDAVWEQAEKYGWDKSLKMLLGEISDLERLVNVIPAAEPESMRRFYVISRILSRAQDDGAYVDSVRFPHKLTWFQIYKIYAEKFKKTKKLPLFDIAYYIFARTRGAFGIEPRYPYYLHWFNFSLL